MFRREQALQIGGYREQLPGASDYDFLWRLTESGGAVNLEEVLYHYRYTSGSISARRAADQARIRRVAQVLAATRQRGQPEDIPAALEGGQSASDAFRAALKQADHFMLAGNFPGARKAYLHLLQSHPWSGLGWAKLFRLAVFVAIPPARESCFRRTSAPSLQRAAASPRVLFVMPGNGQGSSMIFARRQAQSVVREGLEVHLFHLASRTSPRLLIAELHRFRSELARVRPAVVHAHFGTVTALFSALASGSLPLVITYRGSDLNSPPRSYRWQDKLRAVCGCVFSQLAALRAQRIICVSRQLRNHLWWRRGVVTILPTGVDADEFYPKPRALARERLGWTDVERVVLFNAGGDPRVKRLDLAKAAVDRGRRELPELRLEILDGSVLPERLPELMNAADCLLLTSVSEGSPTVVQEALACDLPVVSVAVGDVVERLEGVRNSTVSSSDAAVLGDALVSIVEPPRRSNGSLKIDEFSSRRLAAELKQIYLRLAGT
jgi:glycosyltransferase involved in cell wall biosynthesis